MSESAPARMLRSITRPLIGDIQWQAPGWLKGIVNALGFLWMVLSSWIRSDRKRALIAAGVAALIVAAGAAGKMWYDKLPKPHVVEYETVVPEATAVDNPNAKPEPFVIKFKESVAPLANSGKEVAKGVETTPRIDGVWRWDDDRTLMLTPKSDWPVGTQITVSLAKK